MTETSVSGETRISFESSYNDTRYFETAKILVSASSWSQAKKTIHDQEKF